MTESSPSTEMQNGCLLKQSLLKAFEHLFVRTQCQRDIAEMMKALEQRRPIADLMQTHEGSFSTIFLPFHAGDTRFCAIAKTGTLDPKLLRFCELAAQIENMTDVMGIAGKEPSEDEKTKLLPLLRGFLTMLPTPEEFKSWLQ
ncbi:MAG: hypothetical protein PHX87_01015 [Candidatus Peribacteraceae bacterium]|nr:hypothetical protein [Candidatus Peribacteraceae bacterium]MDD5741990.1 hypothetical protein [Candidatus Peribacteraceae bacterium]